MNPKPVSGHVVYLLLMEAIKLATTSNEFDWLCHPGRMHVSVHGRMRAKPIHAGASCLSVALSGWYGIWVVRPPMAARSGALGPPSHPYGVTNGFP